MSARGIFAVAMAIISVVIALGIVAVPAWAVWLMITVIWVYLAVP